MTRLLLAASLFVVLASCGKTPRTQVMVTLDAEPGVVALAPKLRVTIRSSDASGLVVSGTTVDLGGSLLVQHTVGTAAAPVDYPIDLAIVPLGNDPSRRYWLEVTALSATDEVVSQARVISGFVRERTLTLALVLEDRCIGELACTNAETCRAAGCVPAVVDPATLPRLGESPGADGGSSSTSETWSYGPTLKAIQSASYQSLARSVAIDGNLIALGMPGDASALTGVRPFDEMDPAPASAYESGSVVVYHRNPTTDVWSQEAFIKPDCAKTGNKFGWSVALDGNVLVVGAPYDASPDATCTTSAATTDAGSAYVYRRSPSGTWVREAYLHSPSPHADDRFGDTVDVSAGRVVVGAPEDDSSAPISAALPDPWTGSPRVNTGSAFTYRYDGAGWPFEQHLKASMIADDAEFGSSVAIDGPRIAIGAPYDAGQRGRVYVYELVELQWTSRARLFGSRTAGGMDFGREVVLDGSRIAVAQRWEGSGGIDAYPDIALPESPISGAVYVFVADAAGAWTEETFLKMHYSTHDDGWQDMALALDGDRLAIGYQGEDGTTSGLGTTSNADDGVDVNAGAVFVYRRVGATWGFEEYVKARVAQAGAEFGWSVGVSYPYMVVGAPLEDSDGVGVIDGAPPGGTMVTSGTGYVLRLGPSL